jgi:hypothetical protein
LAAVVNLNPFFLDLGLVLQWFVLSRYSKNLGQSAFFFIEISISLASNVKDTSSTPRRSTMLLNLFGG